MPASFAGWATARRGSTASAAWASLWSATLLSVFLSSFLDAGFVRAQRLGDGQLLVQLAPAVVLQRSRDAHAGAADRDLGQWRTERPPPGHVQAHHRRRPSWLLSLLAVCLFVFTGLTRGPNTAPALLYAPLPLLLWAAVRFGPAATSGCLLPWRCWPSGARSAARARSSPARRRRTACRCRCSSS